MMSSTVEKTPRAPRQPGRSVTARKIAEVALGLFSSRGYDGVSTSDIAKAAGVSQPSIHYHFKQKQDLWQAAMLELASQVDLDMVFHKHVVAATDPLARLKILSVAMFKMNREHPNLSRIILLEGQAGGERLQWLIDNILHTTYSNALVLIQSCIDAGQIKAYQPIQVMLMMHGAAGTYFNVAPLAQAAFDHEPFDNDNAEAFESLFMDVFFASILVAPNEND